MIGTCGPQPPTLRRDQDVKLYATFFKRGFRRMKTKLERGKGKNMFLLLFLGVLALAEMANFAA